MKNIASQELLIGNRTTQGLGVSTLLPRYYVRVLPLMDSATTSLKEELPNGKKHTELPVPTGSNMRYGG